MSNSDDEANVDIDEDERDTYISSPRNSPPSENERSPSPDPAGSGSESPDPRSPIDFSSGDEHASSFQRDIEGLTTKARRSRFRRGDPTPSDESWAARQPEGTVEGYELNQGSDDDSPGSP